jgi:hypothetical protein
MAIVEYQMRDGPVAFPKLGKAKVAFDLDDGTTGDEVLQIACTCKYMQYRKTKEPPLLTSAVSSLNSGRKTTSPPLLQLAGVRTLRWEFLVQYIVIIEHVRWARRKKKLTRQSPWLS